ncbi:MULTISPECIES: dipeptide ABC transporter ATP-binding protein [Gordonia]|uniref:Putative peptide ABC transporter ATP-binding protein n=1 Tax=Gordonia sputi NBRC 100414 TaxID=1089453 RepID=H5TZU5_9ACTN|nr:MULTISPECIES: ABC transporter ATP-binding protein [Gordonia]OBA39260.1 ABC transporter ATP-binding protein [Gordonia sp. 852002-51296_SCH5728562-b]GAB39003.1 putative peptide ABC transporter ATP-binding protein [Gordonia sputi NBRC 100414]
MSLVDIKDLHIAFGSREIVKGVSLQLDAGECLAIVGESGSGKSVTARTLIGLTGDGAEITAERIEFDGQSLRGLSDRGWRKIRGREIGFVLQDALVSLDQLRTVGSEIGEAISVHDRGRAFGAGLSRTARAQRAERVVKLLDLVGVPEPKVRAGQRPHELSGGLRQRALIASALARDPKLVIADEPTTALDATVQAQILEVLRQAKQRGSGIILISHDLAVVASLADRIAVMRSGELVEYGDAQQILSDPQHEYTQGLLAAIPSRASKGTLLTTGATLPSATPISDDQPPALRVRDLRKTFGGRDNHRHAAVQGVSFDLRPGQTLGIVGESGSGKTTTARIVLGLTEPDSGTVELNGRPWSSLSDAQRRSTRQQISVIYQDPLSSFDPRWTVERIIADALRVRGLRGSALDAKVSELLDHVGLSDAFRTRHPLRLSGGQRQRVAIARALAPEPSVIVCDEPVSALDVSIQARILDLLATLQAETGVALLFISHDLGVIHHISDDIIVMRSGEVVESGTADEVFENPQHPYTRELLAAVPTIGGERVA